MQYSIEKVNVCGGVNSINNKKKGKENIDWLILQLE